MTEDFKKIKEELKRKEILWRKKQKERLKGERIKITPWQEKEEIKEEVLERELPQKRPLKTIVGRLKGLRAEERPIQKTMEKEIFGVSFDKEGLVMKKLKTNIYRIFNVASGITIVGLIITFFIMNAQFLLGNLMRIKFIPELTWWEILLLLLVDFAIGLILLIIILLISLLTGLFV